MIPLNFNLCCLCVRLLSSAGTCLLLSSSLLAQVANFHNAPDSTKQLKNPYAGQSTSQGRQLFQANCSKCHGDNAGGMGERPVPEHAKNQECASRRAFLVYYAGRRGQWHAFVGKFICSPALANYYLSARARGATGRAKYHSEHERSNCSVHERAPANPAIYGFSL